MSPLKTRFFSYLLSQKVNSASPSKNKLERQAALTLAYAAIRQGECRLAESELLRLGVWSTRDAECLNLFGLIAEHRDDWLNARRFWRSSVAADVTFLPPRRNLRRYYELFTFGSSSLSPDFGERDGRQCCHAEASNH